MKQNITIKKKYSCLLERGSRNCLLYLFLPFLHFFSRPFLVIFLLLLLRERSIFSASSVIFSLFSSLFLTFLRSPLLSSIGQTQSSQCTGEMLQVYIYIYIHTRISYIGKKRVRERAQTGFLPILIRLPRPGTSVRPF